MAMYELKVCQILHVPSMVMTSKLTETKLLDKYRRFFVCLFIITVSWATIGIVIYYLPEANEIHKVSIVFTSHVILGLVQLSLFCFAGC
jgi:hypothetical protein